MGVALPNNNISTKTGQSLVEVTCAFIRLPVCVYECLSVYLCVCLCIPGVTKKGGD